ncbi:hybrid sensor histidine kinase/response regulator [Nostoc favosum]|uniref:histidine kinase n=1 Tax=Nostoc favosum CHAB5714 TaxID=2780399 RepID=A0ABS8I4X0_9NOSO|nr:ATP-binding protein [Nostoc favosum]MCC5599201.1 PAS domain S-box protein [Nostoc favosum CHAB5714]
MKGIRSLLAPYAVTLLAVGSALLLTLLLQPLLKPSIFLLFFPAVAVSTWYGGMKAGLLATALSTLGVSFFFLEPVFSLFVDNLDSIVRLGLFMLVTTLISLLTSELRTAKQHLQMSLQKLQVSEAKFRRLVESNIIGVIVANMDGAIAEANDAFLTMVGYSQEDLLAGLRWRDMIPPEYIEANNSAMPTAGYAYAELKTKGVCQPFENEYIRKDNSRVPILLGCALLENNPEDVICFVLDLSERKQVELALSKSEERYRAFLEQSSEGIWCMELEVPISPDCPEDEQIQSFYQYGYLAECNNVMAHMYGFSRAEEIISARLGDFLVPSDPHNIAYLYNFIRCNYRLIDAESHEIDKQGNSKYFLNNLVGIVENGLLVRAWGTQRDITERKRAEQEREQLLECEQTARADAEAANRMKDEFLATLSHELHTPLNAILGWTQLLRNRKFDEATTGRALETIERNTKSLAQLIEDVLDVSRIIKGTLHLNMHRVKLVPLVEAAIDTVYPAAQAKEISIKCKFDPEIGVVVGDANRLQQVVWNLLSNAVKFTPKGGRIDVQLERIESYVQIRVSDTGVGIPAEFLSHVFERFRQEDSSITRSHGGLGLGLAIVRHLVELHGGTVSAESPGIGQGATFIVNLPMKAVYVEANTAEQLSSVGDTQDANNYLPNLDGLRVLIVDDEADARHLLTMILGQYGAQVMAAPCASDALLALQEFRPHILVSDIGMPQEDGYTLIRQVRALPTDQGGRIPAVALTAYARAEDRTQALLAGFQLHVPKPVNPAELAAVVANLTGRT